jgi:hypothetical protein
MTSKSLVQIRVLSHSWLAAMKTLADHETFSASEWLRRLLYAKFKEGQVLETLDAEGAPTPPGRPSLKSL